MLRCSVYITVIDVLKSGCMLEKGSRRRLDAIELLSPCIERKGAEETSLCTDKTER